MRLHRFTGARITAEESWPETLPAPWALRQ
jgi:hypothetical protein